MQIHPLAAVDPRAEIGRDASIGPFCVIEADVRIGESTKLESHVVIKRGTTLGARNHVFDGAVLGGLPQHLSTPDRIGSLVIGEGNIIRENVTIHRALHEGAATTIGDANLLMVNVHLAHDCVLGNRTILANNVMLAGHVTVGDRAYLSGAAAAHQFCRIGRLAMVGGQAHVVKDVPPFVTIDGVSTMVVGLNLIGLRRGGFGDEEIRQLKAAYRVIYRSGLKWVDVVERMKVEFPTGPAAAFNEFFAGGTRGFTPERRQPPSATIKLRPAGGSPDDRRAAAG